MDRLPRELIYEIEERLSPREQLTFALTNKSIHTLLKTKLSKHATGYRDYGFISYQHMWKALQHHKNQYLEEIQSKDPGHKFLPTDEEFQPYGPRSSVSHLLVALIQRSYLRKLTIHAHDDMTPLIGISHQLEEVTIIFTRDPAYQTPLDIRVLHALLLPSLKRLSAHVHYGDSVLGPPSNLTHLNLTATHPLENIALESFLARLPQLQHIHYNADSIQGRFIVAKLAVYCRSVRSIHLGQGQREDTHISIPWSNFKALVAINVEYKDVDSWTDVPSTLQIMRILQWPDRKRLDLVDLLNPRRFPKLMSMCINQYDMMPNMFWGAYFDLFGSP